MLANSRYMMPAALLMCLGSVAFFVVGLSFPIFHSGYRLLGIGLKDAEVTLFDAVYFFYDNKEFLLATIIFLFTIVLPIVKYAEMLLRLLGVLPVRASWGVDKWNMLDVFLVALLLLNFKMNSRFIVMELQIGTTFIALAVLTRLLAILMMSNIKCQEK